MWQLAWHKIVIEGLILRVGRYSAVIAPGICSSVRSTVPGYRFPGVGRVPTALRQRKLCVDSKS